MKELIQSISISNDLEEINKNIVKPCKSGKFLYVCCSRKYQVNEIGISLEKLGLSKKRGIYTYKGIVVVASTLKKELLTNFDIIVEVK